MCHRGSVLWHCLMKFQLSTLLRKYIGYLGRCVSVDVIMIYDRQVLGSNRHSCGLSRIKGKRLRSFLCRVVCVLMSITYDLRETQEFMERSKQWKSKWREWERMSSLEWCSKEIIVKRVICYNWSVPHSIIHGFYLKVLLVAGFVIGFIFFKKKMLGKINTNLML